MTVAHIDSGSRIDNRQLRAALARGLKKHFPTAGPISQITRRASPYRTSFALEELKVRLADGTKLDLLFKDCSRAALTEEAAVAKPEFLLNPRRELDIYRNWLEPAALGTPILYAELIDELSGSFGLVLEHVQGRELYQVGEFELWQAAARWLARFHAHFTGTRAAAPGNNLLRYDAAQCWTWLERANRVIATSEPIPSLSCAGWQQIALNFAATIDRLASLPTTLIHGEFFASNILVAGAGTNIRVCPIDWETAAIGPGLLDLAALVAGSWSEQQKAALASEYLSEFQRVSPAAWAAKQEFWADLTACRLHLAVQRIGWAVGWTPPPEHRYDWIADATYLARRIGI